MTEIDLKGTFEGVQCPACRNRNLHHGEVAVFSRGEDAAQTLVTIANGNSHQTSVAITDGEGNPSSRRDGVLISFTCEHCYALPDLEIYQHKGATFIEWSGGKK